MTTTLARIAAASIVAGLAGCASAPAPGCASGEQAMVSEMLYFGTQAPDGAVDTGAVDAVPRRPS